MTPSGPDRNLFIRVLPDLLALAGTAIVVIGVWMKSVPAAVILAGLAVCGMAVALGRQESLSRRKG